MKTEEIKRLQERVGAKPDGFWGPKSIEACQKYLRSLGPVPSPWPRSKDVEKFYGKPADKDNLVTIDVPQMTYIGGAKPQKTSKVTCHVKIADSLKAILEDLKDNPATAFILDEWAGCYNHRNMRGSDRLSLHSWGIAVDFWPRYNGMYTQWPLVAQMPIEVMEVFCKHGWTAAGAFWGRDAMHFQATRPY